MKKLLLLSSITCLAVAAQAIDLKTGAQDQQTENTKFKIEGLFNFQAGLLNQKKLNVKDKNISPYRSNMALHTDSYLSATVEQHAGGITYGGKIVLVPTTKIKSSASINGSHIFLKSEFGKVEIGSPYDAASKLRITGDDVSVGGNWGKFAKLDHTKMQHNSVSAEFADSEDYFLDSVFKTKLKQVHDKTEPGRKISYYTPKFHGLQAGISYTPDSGNTGGGGFAASSTGIVNTKVSSTETYVINQNVKDAISGGISYEYDIADGIQLKVAVTGEYGKPVGNVKLIENYAKGNETILNQYKLSALKTFNLGANLTYGNFSYSASFGSLGKSLTAAGYNKTGRDTKYYNGAIAYGQGPIKTSLAYFKSNKFKNVLDSVTLASEFKLAPGLVPYGEISYFQAKGRPSLYPDAAKKKTKGTILVLGTKLKF